MAYGELQTGLGGERGQFGLPGAGAVAVGAAGVRGDQQPAGVGMVGLAAGVPPAVQRRDREGGGVVVGTDVDPAGVRGDVVDPVRDRLAGPLPVQEVMRLDAYRLTARPPFLYGPTSSF